MTRAVGRPKPEAISGVVGSVLKQLKKSSRTVDEVEKHWKKLVGAEAAQHSWPVALKEGSLRVAVDDPSWSWSLTLQKQRIIEDFKKALGAGVVTTIRFKVQAPPQEKP